jgi:hypothetical protein
MSLIGPLVVLYACRSQPEWFGPIPEWSEFGRVARDLVISGTYPTLVWVVPLLIGIWIGRQDLRSPRVPAGLLVGGAALAVGAFGLCYWLEGVAGAACDGPACADHPRGSPARALAAARVVAARPVRAGVGGRRSFCARGGRVGGYVAVAGVARAARDGVRSALVGCAACSPIARRDTPPRQVSLSATVPSSL